MTRAGIVTYRVSITMLLAVNLCVLIASFREEVRQGVLLREISANTHAPVAVEVSGFSPAAQQVFNQAVKKKVR